VGLSGVKEPGENLADVARSVKGILNDPIKGFGVLSEYASKKVGQYTNLGRPRAIGISSCLEAESAALEQGVVKLSQAVEVALKRHRKGIIEQQLVTKRLADVATDLFIGMCLLSRVSSIIAERGESGAADEIRIAKFYSHLSRGRITSSLRALVKNADDSGLALADSVFANGGYRWDTL
jgi:hypothetical protein